MTGRHELNREAALKTINSPMGRGLATAMVVGAAFGFTLPAAADEKAPQPQKPQDISTHKTQEIAVAKTAEWNIEQVTIDGNDQLVDAHPVAQVTVPEVQAQPAATTEEKAPEQKQEVAPAEKPSKAENAKKKAEVAEEKAEAPQARGEGSSSAVLSTALSYVGAPYRAGGTTPAGWDCIGFVRYVYAQYGVHIGGSTTSVLSAGQRVPFSEARPGDILYWPGHVAIYAGGNSNVGAWNEGMGTRVGPNSWVGGTPTVIRVF